VPALLLIVAVLGAIMVGIATPTEAASVGAFGAVVLTIAYGKFKWKVLHDTLKRTLVINCMILLIVVGGTMFSQTFRIHGGNRLVADMVNFFDLPAMGVLTVLLIITFLAGFILDWVSLVLICLPIFLPLLTAMGIDQIWFGVMMIVVIQTSYLTPPMAPSIFYLRSIAPPEITYGDMYRGVAPFIACQVVVLILVILFPTFATYLPKLLVTGF
jgi:tripartite ATP-independent transporter DctM subunit